MKVVMIALYGDPLHGGHCAHVREAKALGGYLIACVGTEDQCRKKHGGCFLTWQEKVDMLKGWGVDEVVPAILDENGSCWQTILRYRPDIFAKGDLEGVEPIPEKEQWACDLIGCRIMYGVGKRVNHSSKFWRRSEK